MHRAEEKKKNTRRALVLLCVCMCGWCLEQSMKKKGERGEALSIRDVTRVQGTKEENSGSFPNLPVQQCNETTAAGKRSGNCLGPIRVDKAAGYNRPLSPSPDL